MPAIVNLSCALCENAINVCLEFPIYGVPPHWWHPRPIWSRNLISNICAIINLPGLRWVIKAHQLVKSWESGLGLTRLPITFLAPIVKFFMKVLCDSELEISSHFLQLLLSSVLSQSGLSPLRPLLCNMCWRCHCTKMTVQISIVSLFIFFFYCSRFFLQIWKIQLVGIVSHMWCRYNMHHVPHSYVSWLSISISDIKVLPFGRRFFKHHEFVCLPKCELWPCLTSFCPLLADRELFISWMFGFCHRHCTATLSNN